MHCYPVVRGILAATRIILEQNSILGMQHHAALVLEKLISAEGITACCTRRGEVAVIGGGHLCSLFSASPQLPAAENLPQESAAGLQRVELQGLSWPEIAGPL